jgi:hypothetical protein
MSMANNSSKQRSGSVQVREKLQAPWFVHVYVWAFMITLGVSPVLCVLDTREGIAPSDAWIALAAVLLIQNLIWLAQRRCSGEDLTFWEGLLVAAASMTTGIVPLTLALSFGMLLFTVGASFVFALAHDRRDPLHHASIRFAILIIAIHKRRLYR